MGFNEIAHASSACSFEVQNIRRRDSSVIHLVARINCVFIEKFGASGIVVRTYTDFVETCILRCFFLPFKQEFPPVNNKSKSKSAGRVISADGNHGDSKTDTISSSKQSSEKNDTDSVNKTTTIT